MCRRDPVLNTHYRYPTKINKLLLKQCKVLQSTQVSWSCDEHPSIQLRSNNSCSKWTTFLHVTTRTFDRNPLKLHTEIFKGANMDDMIYSNDMIHVAAGKNACTLMTLSRSARESD